MGTHQHLLRGTQNVLRPAAATEAVGSVPVQHLAGPTGQDEGIKALMHQKLSYRHGFDIGQLGRQTVQLQCIAGRMSGHQ